MNRADIDMESANSLVCVLCRTSDEEDQITGTLSTKQDITAHQNCLLYSSGLVCRESPQLDDLFGFSVSDVLKEIKRGSKLKCHKCDKKGATVGCENKRCKKSFHYPCAVKAGAHNVDDITTGSFVLYCGRCKKTKLGLPDDDSNSSNASPHNHKRKLDLNGRQEEKKAHKRSRRIDADDSDSDLTDAGEEMGFPPLESDDEEIASPEQKQPVVSNGFMTAATQTQAPVSPGTSSDLKRETQDRDEDNSVSVLPSSVSEVNSEQSLVVLMEATDVSLDSTNFWRDCASAGCTQAVFSDFIREMTDIFTRITSGQANREDCDVAFKVMMASGKLKELVAKQQKECQTKLAKLLEATDALQRVASFLQS